MPIRKLPEALISQIAAGEVIERPASCLKELLDNAVDSGASSISASIEGGGMRSIRVEDNGCGIPEPDLPLAFERHATSKIASFDDLRLAMTLGFRGEALASAASVARAEIHSRARGASLAFRASCESAGPVSLAPSPRKEGTSVEIRDLFFFVPARRKFLKSEATESSKCREAFLSCALSRPSVAMSFSKDGKRLHQLPAQTLRERAAALLGEAFSSAASEADSSWGDYRLRGLLAPLPALPSGKDLQLLFVNGRRARDKSLSHALKEALAQSRRGGELAYVLFLDLPPEMVDANAHPAKIEVRFRDPRSVHQFVLKSALEALGASAAPAAPPSALAASFRRKGGHLSAPAGWRGPLPEPEADLFGSSGSPSPVLPLASGWVGVDLPSGLWLLHPLEARLACLAERVRSLAESGSLPSVPLLAPARAIVDPEAARLLRSYSRQLESLGLSVSAEGSEAIVSACPEPFLEADLSGAIEGVALALRSGANAFRLCLALGRRLPEEILLAEPLSDALASIDLSALSGAQRVAPCEE